MLDDDPDSTPTASPPPATTTEPSPMEAHTEEPAQKDGPSVIFATPPRSPNTTAPEPPQAAQSPHVQSPGLGSGTKETDAETTLTRQIPVPACREIPTSVPAPEVRPVSAPKGKDPAPSTDLPALDSMSVPALCEEYFSRLAKHKTLQTELVAMIQKRYQVYFLHCPYFFCISIP